MGKKVRFKRTTMLSIGCCALLAGLGLARLEISLQGLVLLPLLLVTLLLFRGKNLVSLLLVVIFCLGVGLWRGSQTIQQLRPYKSLGEHKVAVVVQADEDAIYGDKSQITFDASHVRVTEPYNALLPGKIKIAGFGIPMVYRGDTVKVEGKLFPTRGSRQASIGFAQLTLIGKSHSFVASIKRKFQAGMQSALPEPSASFAMGLLVGQRNTLPSSITTLLAAVGLTHIVAVSGYNLTILSRAGRRLIGKRSKYQTFVLSTLLIVSFVMLTGLSASIVRAAIVSMLSLFAWYYGRQFKPFLLIVLTAALTALWNPLYLWSDVGWYLSFLAFFGILMVAPMIARRLQKHVDKPLNPLKLLLIETVSAQIMTIPLIMFIFGQVSLISIVANVAVVPFVPLAMLLSVIAGGAGMLLPSIAGWLAWPARVVLTYMIDIATLLSRVPHALSQSGLAWWQMLALYCLLAILTVVIWHKNKARSAIITDIEMEQSLT